MDTPKNPPKLLVLGVAMGDKSSLSPQTIELMGQYQDIFFRTNKIRLHQTLSEQFKCESLDRFFENSTDFRDVVNQIQSIFYSLWKENRNTAYIVSGSPILGDAVSAALTRYARDKHVEVKIVGEADYLTQLSEHFSGPLSSSLKLVDALELKTAYFPPFSLSDDVIIHHLHEEKAILAVLNLIRTVYPKNHSVKWISLMNPAETGFSLTLENLGSTLRADDNGILYLPGLGKHASYEAFQDIVAHLRAPDGCPWDRKQTHNSLRTSLLEETYEMIEAIDTGDKAGLQEELGDLLLQIGLHAQIAADNAAFTIADVLTQINHKLIHRHPHVFAADRIDTVDELLQNWEKLKAEERKTNGREGKKGMLDGVPKHLAALAQAQAYQDRAARVGFDWDRIADVWEKVFEELDEVKASDEPQSLEEELGDLLFAVVNLIRWYKIDAETALRLANRKFIQRFRYIEEQADIHQLDLAQMSLAEMDKFWDEAKKNGL
jgi:tetrapyrrole methylase family protein/MazG family protein